MSDVLTFSKQMHELFNSHGDKLLEAEEKLSKLDFDGFHEVYNGMKLEDLREIVKSQHIKINELYGVKQQLQSSIIGVMKDLNNCDDLITFGKLKHKASIILMAVQLEKQGKSEAEITERINKSLNDEPIIKV